MSEGREERHRDTAWTVVARLRRKREKCNGHGKSFGCLLVRRWKGPGTTATTSYAGKLKAKGVPEESVVMMMYAVVIDHIDHTPF